MVEDDIRALAAQLEKVHALLAGGAEQMTSEGLLEIETLTVMTSTLVKRWNPEDLTEEQGRRLLALIDAVEAVCRPFMSN